MDPNTLRTMLEEAVRNAEPLRLWALFVVILVAAVSGFVASYFGAYLRAKGQSLATKEDFQQLLHQIRKTTEATEEIKSQVLRRSSFYEKVLLERYTLIKDINYRLEIVRIAFERIKKNQKPGIEIVEGETLLLTETYAALQLNRSILGGEFYDLLSERYKLVSELWKYKNNESEWNNQIKLWYDLNDKIQSKMEKTFAFGQATIDLVAVENQNSSATGSSESVFEKSLSG